jgi:hypothetical protein
MEVEKCLWRFDPLFPDFSAEGATMTWLFHPEVPVPLEVTK